VSKILAIPVAVLLVLSIPLSLLVFDIGEVLFDPVKIKGIVAEEVLRADPIPLVLQWFSQRQAQAYQEQTSPDPNREPSIFEILAHLDLDDWRAIRDEVLPDEFVITWVNTAVDGVYDWLDSDARVPQVVFDLRESKARINSEHGRNAVQIVYAALPACTPSQIDDFRRRQAAAPPGTEVPYNVCQFPAPWAEDQFNDYLTSLNRVIENVPDEFNLTKVLAQQAENPQGVGPETLKDQINTLSVLFYRALLLPLALLIVTLLLTVRSLAEFGCWWGIPLTLGGLLALVIAVLYRPLITAYLLTGPLSEAPAAIQQNALHAGLRLAEEIFQPMVSQAIVLITLGLGVWVITAFIGYRRKA